MRTWVTKYVGFPDYIVVDQGTQFSSHEWESLLRATVICAKASGVEGHNAIGTGERYQSYLSRVYIKVKAECPALDSKLMLQLAVKAVNNTAGPFGLVPRLLVLGILPGIPLHPQKLPDQASRMNALHRARK